MNTVKCAEYNQLVSMTPEQKFHEGNAEALKFLDTGLINLENLTRDKKKFSDFKYEKESMSALNVGPIELDLYEQMRTVAGRRRFNQNLVYQEIKSRDREMQRKHKGKKREQFTKDKVLLPILPFQTRQELLEASSVDILKDVVHSYYNENSDFFKNNTKKDIYNFFVQYFGFDFQSGLYRTRKENTEWTTGWKDKKDRVNYGRLENHITGMTLVQAQSYAHSKVVKVEIENVRDIQNHTHYLSLSDMAYVISSEFGGSPFFVERSTTSRGFYRMYFLLEDYLPNREKLLLEHYFKDQFKFNMSIQKDTEYMTLPFSKETLLRGKFSKSLLGVERESLQESLTRIPENFKTKRFTCKMRPIENMIGKIRYGKVIESEIQDYELEDGSYATASDTGYEKFEYGNGTRFVNQVKLSVWSVGKGLSLSEYISLAFELNDGTSKDMKKWGKDRATKTLTGYYDWASTVAEPSQPQTDTNDNKKRVRTYTVNEDGTKSYCIRDTNILTGLDNSNMKNDFLYVVNHHYNQMYKSDRQQGVWKKYFHEDALALYKFLERKKNYDETIGKKYKEEKFRDLDSGVLFPSSVYTDVKKHLHLRTNVKKLVKFLVDVNLLDCIEIEGFEFSYKNDMFARHYRLVDKENLKNLARSIKWVYSTESTGSTVCGSVCACNAKSAQLQLSYINYRSSFHLPTLSEHTLFTLPHEKIHPPE